MEPRAPEESPASPGHHIPSLPKCLFTKTYHLRKTGVGRKGWGLVLKGTTSELEGGFNVYTCHVADVAEDGEAKAQGVCRGDLITMIEDIQVRDLDHVTVVKIFQQRDKLKLSVIPAEELRLSLEVRITKHNLVTLPSVWALMNNLNSLEIVGVNLARGGVYVGSLINMRSLSLCHCSLSTLEPIQGLRLLRRLRTLSVAHNYLSDDVFTPDCALHYLFNLRKLDLSRNLLSNIPNVVCERATLEVLVIVDNNITVIPENFINLKSLHTLCLDGNLLSEVDTVVKGMPTLSNLSVSNNCLECEPEVIRNGCFSIASVQDNPYTRGSSDGEELRNEPTLRRALSVRGQVLSSKKISLLNL